MSVDASLVERHRTFEHEIRGERIRESFVPAVLGGTRTTAVAYEPVDRVASSGWVLCHSFGIEQTFLGEHEVTVARALAAAGFAVLRYHGSGYGDSQGDPRSISLSSHLADAADAVALARERGVRSVGVAGPRFGALVAALTAERLDLPLLVAWEPVVKGAQFMRELLRSRDLFNVVRAADDETAPLQIDPLEELGSRGWSDVKGVYLTREANDEIAATDLRKDLRSFDGEALVVSVSRTERPSSPASALVERIRAIGGTAELDVVRDDEAPNFGQYHYDNEDDPNAKHDLQVPLIEALSRTTVAWARRHAAAGVGAPR